MAGRAEEEAAAPGGGLICVLGAGGRVSGAARVAMMNEVAILVSANASGDKDVEGTASGDPKRLEPLANLGINAGSAVVEIVNVIGVIHLDNFLLLINY